MKIKLSGSPAEIANFLTAISKSDMLIEHDLAVPTEPLVDTHTITDVTLEDEPDTEILNAPFCPPFYTGTTRYKIMAAVTDYGEPLTGADIAKLTSLDTKTITPRIPDLVRQGVLFRTNDERPYSYQATPGFVLADNLSAEQKFDFVKPKKKKSKPNDDAREIDSGKIGIYREIMSRIVNVEPLAADISSITMEMNLSPVVMNDRIEEMVRHGWIKRGDHNQVTAKSIDRTNHYYDSSMSLTTAVRNCIEEYPGNTNGQLAKRLIRSITEVSGRTSSLLDKTLYRKGEGTGDNPYRWYSI